MENLATIPEVGIVSNSSSQHPSAHGKPILQAVQNGEGVRKTVVGLPRASGAF